MHHSFRLFPSVSTNPMRNVDEIWSLPLQSFLLIFCQHSALKCGFASSLFWFHKNFLNFNLKLNCGSEFRVRIELFQRSRFYFKKNIQKNFQHAHFVSLKEIDTWYIQYYAESLIITEFWKMRTLCAKTLDSDKFLQMFWYLFYFSLE